jgi:hypothetical protein
MKLKSSVWAAAALAILSAGSLQAQTFGVQFGAAGTDADTGTGVFGESFVLVTGETPTTSLGGGITFTTTLTGGGYAQEFNANSGNNGVFEGSINTSSATSTLTFEVSGLSADSVYEIAGYAGGDATVFSTNTGTASPSHGGFYYEYTAAQPDQVGVNTIELTADTDANGNLFVYATGDQNPNDPGSDGYSNISGLSIEGPNGGVAVPEPSTWSLMAAGVAALVFFARRRSANC